VSQPLLDIVVAKLRPLDWDALLFGKARFAKHPRKAAVGKVGSMAIHGDVRDVDSPKGVGVSQCPQVFMVY